MKDGTIHIGVTDIICRARLMVREDGSVRVEVTDGVREFDLDVDEAVSLYCALGDRLRRIGRA